MAVGTEVFGTVCLFVIYARFGASVNSIYVAQSAVLAALLSPHRGGGGAPPSRRGVPEGTGAGVGIGESPSRGFQIKKSHIDLTPSSAVSDDAGGG